MTREAATATYLYCLVHSPTRPSLARKPRGLPGLGRVRAVPAGGPLWLIVADAPLARYGAAPIERGLRDLEWVSACAMGHDAVIAHAARHATVLPMKLFTLFGTDERALAHIGRRRRKLDRLLGRVAGRREWGVRLSLPRTRAPGVAAARRERQPAGIGSGTRFLLRKKAAHETGRQLWERGQTEARRVFRELGRRASAARRRAIVHDGGGPRVLLDAAFLVPVAHASRFRAAVRATARRVARAGYEVTLTGPWPPYSFVTERL